MRKRYFIFGFLAVVVISLYFIDRKLWMKQRVMIPNMWEMTSGERNRGDFIYTEDIVDFKGDTMIFDHGNNRKDTLVLKWQYLNAMKVMDPRTRKTTIYEIKGTSWIDYCWGRYSIFQR